MERDFMRVAIVGAGGEIGYYFYRYLKNRGFDVVPIVRGSLGPLLSRYSIEPTRVDMTDVSSIDAALSGCDSVINCMIDKQAYKTDQEKVRRNLICCRNLLLSAIHCRLDRMIHLSSIVVLPPRITDSVLSGSVVSKEKDWYSRTKILTERLFRDKRSEEVSVVVLRPGIVYGAYMNWSAVAFERTEFNVVRLPDEVGKCYTVHPLDLARLSECLLSEKGTSLPKVVYGVNPESISWYKFYSGHAHSVGAEDRVALMSPDSPARRVEKPRGSSRSQYLSQRVLNWAFESDLLQVPRWYAMRELVRFANSRFGNVFRSPDRWRSGSLYPSSFELDMYRSDGDIGKAEIGQSVGFRYKVPFKKGVENAALWRLNQFELAES